MICFTLWPLANKLYDLMLFAYFQGNERSIWTLRLSTNSCGSSGKEKYRRWIWRSSHLAVGCYSNNYVIAKILSDASFNHSVEILKRTEWRFVKVPFYELTCCTQNAFQWKSLNLGSISHLNLWKADSNPLWTQIGKACGDRNEEPLRRNV